MKCPACGESLSTIPPMREEWHCNNDDCPSGTLNEWYGTKQSEINKQWKGIPAYYKSQSLNTRKDEAEKT